MSPRRSRAEQSAAFIREAPSFALPASAFAAFVTAIYCARARRWMNEHVRTIRVDRPPSASLVLQSAFIGFSPNPLWSPAVSMSIFLAFFSLVLIVMQHSLQARTSRLKRSPYLIVGVRRPRHLVARARFGCTPRGCARPSALWAPLVARRAHVAVSVRRRRAHAASDDALSSLLRPLL